jgi:predicted TIM-barrel fold metal-dependent hydrolase
LNEEWGSEFYRVPREATLDERAAAEVFAGPEVVVDVQTHFLAGRGSQNSPRIDEMYRRFMPSWWSEMDDLVRRDLAEWVTNVYLESETAVAVLTSGPDTLLNQEMAAMRSLIDELAGPGRLLNHVVVHAEISEELESMARWRDEYAPVGWKVYTPGRLGPEGWVSGWMLDDEEYGFPFLERARDLAVPLVCAHKGISMLVDNGSPRDIGPAARAFPELDFVVYHAGYEFFEEGDETTIEGPYTDATANRGVNRLLRSVEEAGLGRRSNVHAELGTTWFALIRRPVDAAHVLGKLISVLGEDNVIWGTDSVWYGGAQPLIDAFRSFQIPDEMCERFGYSPLTSAVKAKILGENASHLYGIDLERARRNAENDDLGWVRTLVERYRADQIRGIG